MAPPPIVVKEQLLILVDFLEENKDNMAKGAAPYTPANYQVSRQQWISVAKKINAVPSGTIKTPEGWKKYWFEWRHRCRKKAANVRRFQSTSTDGSASRFTPLNDIECRVLKLCEDGAVRETPARTKKLKKNLADDSDSDPLEDLKTSPKPVSSKPRHSVTRRSKAVSKWDDIEDSRSVSPPPKWAINFEERRIAAEERMADALESIASVMKTQEERRANLDEQMVNAVTALAGTVQDLNNGIHEAIQRLHQQHVQNGVDAKKEIFY